MQEPWSRCVTELREAGCSGLEARLPMTLQERHALRDRLRAEALDYIAIVFSGVDVVPRQADRPAIHLQHLARAFDAAAELQPRFVNLLAGNDRWPLSEQVDFLGRAQDLADDAGVPCSFETHRASSLYSPWVTLDIVRQLPRLRYTADISHWVVVCERLLDDPLDDLTPFLERVHHVQARVGYSQGPQVPDPAAPEYAPELAFHQRIWETAWSFQHASGYTTSTLTPEFGPDGYLHLLPYTRSPVADLWQLNRWMAQQERTHFARWSQQHGIGSSSSTQSPSTAGV
ncbi:TIM barrel protein [uncultured Herbaspirillum sp.]|uniref:sugar phosphate isomerase/epimerase family protein n=1 Tax=uncultured Herbaspirillum sp. TaxID=160236 RepID=UPI0025905AA3|nr:TIM barrel protein [uncultured Herbaspirillum sp.]